MKFADKMKQYRCQRNWTQQDVAERLTISRKTVSSWENSRSYPDIFMLVQISDLYHVNLDDLLREDHEMMDNYKEEHKINNRERKMFVASYFLNILIVCCSLLKISFLQNINNGVIRSFLAIVPFILIANIIFLVSHTDWHEIKRKWGFWITWVIISILRLQLTFIKPIDVPANNLKSGYITGLITGSIIMGLCLSCIIWLFPQFQRKGW